MNWPDIGWRYLLIAIVLVLIAAVALVYLPSTVAVKTINAYFSPTNKLAPGQNTNLMVEVTNTLDQDTNSFDITVTPINEGIVVGEFPKPTGTIGKGEMRKIAVPLSLSSDLLEGTYSVEIIVTLEDKAFSSRATLEVKK